MTPIPLPEECKHEHIGWYGGVGEPQTCVDCRKTINEIVLQSYEQGKKETAEAICLLLDDIELKSEITGGSTLEEWKQWKHIRNAIRDKYIRTKGKDAL